VQTSYLPTGLYRSSDTMVSMTSTTQNKTNEEHNDRKEEGIYTILTRKETLNLIKNLASVLTEKEGHFILIRGTSYHIDKDDNERQIRINNIKGV